MIRWLGALSLLASLILPAAGLAATAGEADAGIPELSLVFEGCPPVEAGEIERLVRSDVTMAPGDPPTVVTFTCRDRAVVLTTLGDEGTTEQRAVDLAATAKEAQPRAVALIAIELILGARRSSAAPVVLPARKRARRDSVADDGAPTELPVGASSAAPEPSAPAQRARAAEPSASLRLLGLAGASIHRLSSGSASSVPPALELGARVRLEDRTIPWTGTLELGGLLQQRSVDIGTARAAGGQAALFFEASARSPSGAVAGALGLGARANVLRVGATTDQVGVRSTTAWGAALGPTARARVTWQAGRFVADVTVDGGWLGPQVVGSTRDVPTVGVGGFWAGVSLAAGAAISPAATNFP